MESGDKSINVLSRLLIKDKQTVRGYNEAKEINNKVMKIKIETERLLLEGLHHTSPECKMRSKRIKDLEKRRDNTNNYYDRMILYVQGNYDRIRGNIIYMLDHVDTIELGETS